jgi:ABC-2 type transport system permease protein
MVTKAKSGKSAKNRRNLKRQAILQAVLLSGILLFLNVISSFWFTRFDLTDDKRFTISESSRRLMSGLKDIVFVKVYLSGDFSPAFTRLSQATREMLDELRTYSNGNLEYEFVDPSASPDEKERNLVYAQLYQKGIRPTTVEERTKEGTKRTYIFPGAIVSYSNVEMSVQLLQNQIGVPPELQLNNSIQNLEFELCNTIRKATNPLRPIVGFLDGQGELDTLRIADFASAVQSSYELRRIRINGQLDALKDLRCLVVARPDSAFDEKDKFIIDQYVMRGGRVVWLLDPMQADMDSLSNRGEMIALARDLKLDDMLFRYGVRVNYDLVQDLMASLIPVVTGMVGNQPKQQLLPWYYFPVMTPDSRHPIVNNLNSIRGQFVSSVDPIEVEGVKHTVLLTSSRYSRILPAPVRVSLGIMQFKPDPKQFPVRNIPVAVLLEGEFTSLYKNRIPPAIADSKEIGFRERSTKNKMLVVGDGDLIRNDIQRGKPLELGYDKYMNMTYGNKSFLLNALDYLIDESGLMLARNKEFRLRMIDPSVLESDTRPLAAANVGLPLVLILVFGVVKGILRRRAFAKR